MFRSTPYSSIPDRYSPYLPEEFLPVWKIRKKRKAGISPPTDQVLSRRGTKNCESFP